MASTLTGLPMTLSPETRGGQAAAVSVLDVSLFRCPCPLLSTSGHLCSPALFHGYVVRAYTVSLLMPCNVALAGGRPPPPPSPRHAPAAITASPAGRHFRRPVTIAVREEGFVHPGQLSGLCIPLCLSDHYQSYCLSTPPMSVRCLSTVCPLSVHCLPAICLLVCPRLHRMADVHPLSDPPLCLSIGSG